jgi:hypothetical protein
MSKHAESLSRPQAAQTEHEFWSSEPAYSEPPPRFSLRPAVPRPSRLRRALARTLFSLLFAGALALLTYEVALKYGITWPDVVAFAASIRG